MKKEITFLTNMEYQVNFLSIVQVKCVQCPIIKRRKDYFHALSEYFHSIKRKPHPILQFENVHLEFCLNILKKKHKTTTKNGKNNNKRGKGGGGKKKEGKKEIKREGKKEIKREEKKKEIISLFQV